MKTYQNFLVESITKYYFHGTSSLYLSDIKNKGLKPGSGIVRSFDMTIRDVQEEVGVYVTTEFYIALQEAIATVTGVDKWWNLDDLYPNMYSRKGQPVILVLDPNKTGIAKPDVNYGEYAFVINGKISPDAVIDVVEFRIGKSFDWKALNQTQLKKYAQGKTQIPLVKFAANTPDAIHTVASIAAKHNLAASGAWVSWVVEGSHVEDWKEIFIEFNDDYSWKAEFSQQLQKWDGKVWVDRHQNKSDLGKGPLDQLDKFLSAILKKYPAKPPRDLEDRKFRSTKQLFNYNVRNLQDND